MSYRYSNTDKWSDAWFSNLKQIEMLLFVYLCDNCDIAGFIEVNYKRWANDLGSSIETIEGACKGLARGLILSKDSDCMYLKNFLKHQKNLPLNSSNKAHMGILKRFDLYSHKFGIENVNDFIEGACKGLLSPTGNGSGIGSMEESMRETKPDQLFETPKTWREDFTVYKSECGEAFKKLTTDREFMTQLQYFNPKLNILKSLQKSYIEFWGTDRGWKHKKKSKSLTIDWNTTITNALSLPSNKVYLDKNEQPIS